MIHKPLLFWLVALLLSATGQVHAAEPAQRTAWREQAQALEHGEGVPRDTEAAIRLYCQAALAGDAVAAYAIANAGRLNIKYVIWKPRIWLPGSGWRGMADRGSPTQNHFDHVHISVY